MKKKILRTLALVLALSIMLAVPAFAVVQPRATFIEVDLTYDNATTARCSVIVAADNLNYPIVGRIRLMRNGLSVSTWPVNTAGYLDFEDTEIVLAGQTYTLEVDVTVNGRAQPIATDTKTSPSN